MKDALNGTLHLDSDPPGPENPVEALRTEVRDVAADVSSLRGEVQRGFADLSAKDQEHDRKLADLAKEIAVKVTIPVAGVAVLIELLRVIAAALGH